ncbi:glycine decarboxylase subunit P [Mycoemilia scoparia]|uniref:Glycine cleavage system P protein n=1 Tax=Mycoemilia scoparia TaxID=417184 RepID=A0A9W8A624_9FUNG|nr:glycine decarboxylase subunit P [Mycoemilia scoparia]
MLASRILSRTSGRGVALGARLASLQYRSTAAAVAPIAVAAKSWASARQLHTQKPVRSSAAAASEASGDVAGKLDVASAAEFALAPLDTFTRRHTGPRTKDVAEMLATLNLKSLDELVSRTVPDSIRLNPPLVIPEGGVTERELLARIKSIAAQNKPFRSFIGAGYTDVEVPPVILRNILENPSWYTQYSPYQAEISQGRLESLLNFQTMVSDLTGLPIANSSLLDEGTAAGEALVICLNAARKKTKNLFFADSRCHPQTLAVLHTRAEGFGAEVVVGEFEKFDFNAVGDRLCGAMVSYPDTYGNINDYKNLSETVHANGGNLVVVADLVSLTVLQPPSSFGADIVLGNSQRFGVPMGNGGPHAAFFAATEKHKRSVPGRIVGLSRDANGDPAYRLALQTREQHIRREKASSNICTAQALLANMAAMYAVYHGPEGLRAIANRIHRFTSVLASAITEAGHTVENSAFFDTLSIKVASGNSKDIIDRAVKSNVNLRKIDGERVGVTLDEVVTRQELATLIEIFGGNVNSVEQLAAQAPSTVGESTAVPSNLVRQGEILNYPVFHRYHSETEMLRYITELQNRDLSLANAMIPLGSCTMKLNATTQMIPVTWPEFGRVHPFAPEDQKAGYHILFRDLEQDLALITGMDATSLQPNSGAQGEYAGLRAIRGYQAANGQGHRNICLIPQSAHGTNPASAVMAGLKVVSVKCLENGNLDLADLEAKAKKHADNLSAVMITYPSTYGVFEDTVLRAIELVHSNGGQVYMDGANLNAQIGLCNPGSMGADVCHINAHKTLAIPHGGGGPGMGPITVKSHLAPFLPGHINNTDAVTANASAGGSRAVSAAPYSSASILTISWSYIKLLGGDGMTQSTKTALLNANYMANRLRDHYTILFTNKNGMCAHEFIIDCRPFDKISGIQGIDIAKRLQDYGFHSPTMSWPVSNTLMIEPTESESREELDRFCDAMISIRNEIREIEEGKQPRDNNVLKNSPHTIRDVSAETWDRPYSRVKAAFPLASLQRRKFWPTIRRVDDVYGDTNLVCSCPPMSSYE